MATFTQEALKQKINEINEFKTTKELKSLLNTMGLKKSRFGVSNKIVLRTILLDDWLKDFDLDHSDIVKDRDLRQLYLLLF